MPHRDKRRSEAQEPKQSRLQEARRVIEEYAAELREIVEKLRQKMH
jgi:hypothetical protein